MEDETGWHVEIVADPPATIYAGTYQPLVALALDASGAPHLAFLDPTHRSVLSARRADGGWRIETAATAAPGKRMTYETALALAENGEPHIVYAEAGVLTHAQRTGDGWVSEIVDGKGWMEMYFSLQVDRAGEAHVSYFAASGKKACIKYAQRIDGRWQTEFVDRSGFLGEFNSLALDRAGAPHISYLDTTHRRVKHARRRGDGQWAITLVDAAQWFGGFTSIAVDRAGHPHISYTGVGDEARYAFLTGAEWRIRPLARNVWYTALALDKADAPIIAYYERSTCELVVARWDGRQWLKRRVDGVRPGAPPRLEEDGASP